MASSLLLDFSIVCPWQWPKDTSCSTDENSVYDFYIRNSNCTLTVCSAFSGQKTYFVSADLFTIFWSDIWIGHHQRFWKLLNVEVTGECFWVCTQTFQTVEAVQVSANNTSTFEESVVVLTLPSQLCSFSTYKNVAYKNATESTKRYSGILNVEG